MKDYRIGIFRTILVFLYSGMLLILLACIVLQGEGLWMNSSITNIQITGTAQADDGPIKPLEEVLDDGDIRKTLVLDGHFNQTINDGQSLILWPRNLRVKLYINGELRLSVGQREEFPWFIEYAGNSFQIHYIGEVTPSDAIHLEIEKAYESCRINVLTIFFDNFYVGYESDVVHSILQKELIHPFIGFFFCILGSGIFTLSLVHAFSNYSRMYYFRDLGLFCFAAGIFYISDSCYEYIDLFWPHPVINTLIDLLSLPLLLLFFIVFIVKVVQNHFSKLFTKCILVLYVLAELYPLILQFAGIRDLHEMQDEYTLIGSALVIASSIALLYDIIVIPKSTNRKTLLTACPLLMTLTLKVINIVFENSIERTYLRIGILISYFFLLYSTFHYVIFCMRAAERELKIREELQDAQISIMLSQIQPHFLFNSLNILQHLCEIDHTLAAQGLEHFSNYLRANMESLTERNPIPFKKELSLIQDYVYMEQLRFGARVQIEYELECTDFYIPTLSLQPLIENAIRHGITKQELGGTVKIITKQIKDKICIQIIDNGIGFKQPKASSDPNKHIALQNIRQRLALQMNGTLSIASTPGHGTTVTIYIPK